MPALDDSELARNRYDAVGATESLHDGPVGIQGRAVSRPDEAIPADSNLTRLEIEASTTAVELDSARVDNFIFRPCQVTDSEWDLET